jgi:glutamine cyclotransferase
VSVRLALFALLLCCAPALLGAPTIPYEVVASYPHRSEAFTQGAQLVDDTLYESSGLYGQSFLVRWRPGGDEPLLRTALPKRIFAEGLTVLDGRLYLLTWQQRRGLIFQLVPWRRLGEFRYPGAGWGLTHNGRELIMSDGSAELRFLAADDQRELRRLTVTEDGEPVQRLNELEWVQGRVLANVWLTDEIVAIDPASGMVTARLDLGELYPAGQRSRRADVLNGIAFDPRDGTLLVTGKFWPRLYRIRLLKPLP